jgi:hypothetical protein
MARADTRRPYRTPTIGEDRNDLVDAPPHTDTGHPRLDESSSTGRPEELVDRPTEDGHPRAANPPAWRVLLAYARPYRLALIGGGLLSLATGAVGLALPLAAKGLIDDLANDRAVTGALLLTVLALANAGIGAAGSYVLERAAESVVLDARCQLVAHLVRLRIPAVDRSEPGDLMARVTSDTTLLREVTTGSLVSAVTSTLMLLATVTMMALLDPLLLVVTLAVLGGAQAVIGVVVPRISRARAGRAGVVHRRARPGRRPGRLRRDRRGHPHRVPAVPVLPDAADAGAGRRGQPVPGRRRRDRPHPRGRAAPG